MKKYTVNIQLPAPINYIDVHFVVPFYLREICHKCNCKHMSVGQVTGDDYCNQGNYYLKHITVENALTEKLYKHMLDACPYKDYIIKLNKVSKL